MLTTHEVTAEFAVSKEDAEAERRSAPVWYRLPVGWTWEQVAAQRLLWWQPSDHFPLKSLFGVTVWGEPRKPERKRDRIKAPWSARRDGALFLMTAACARTIPGGQLAARKAIGNARFYRLHGDFQPTWGD